MSISSIDFPFLYLPHIGDLSSVVTLRSHQCIWENIAYCEMLLFHMHMAQIAGKQIALSELVVKIALNLSHSVLLKGSESLS